MNDGIQRRGTKDRQIFSTTPEQNAKDQTAKESFFNHWHNDRSSDEPGETEPVNGGTHRKDTQRDQKRAAAEEGKRREKKACQNISQRMAVSFQREI